jgi:hypothetical protein
VSASAEEVLALTPKFDNGGSLKLEHKALPFDHVCAIPARHCLHDIGQRRALSLPYA